MQKIEVHHIEPQADGGDDVEENAAPLCSNCHTLYGGNPELRKEIRLRRDAWYEKCIAGSDFASAERRGSSLHSVMVGLMREWQAVHESLKNEINYFKGEIGAGADDLMAPISRELDDAAELLGFKPKIAAFMSFITPDDMMPFRKAFRRMANDTGAPKWLEFDGTIGYDERPMPFTSYHDVGLMSCSTANTILNLPFAIKSYNSQANEGSGPRTNEIIAQMQIEATYVEAGEMPMVTYDELPEKDDDFAG